MFKSPLVIEVEDVFGFVKMKPMEKWSEEAIKKAYQETTQRMLEDFELMIKHSLLIKEAQRDTSCSFGEKLTARIIDNLQVSIKNIYFRFEDSILEGQAISKKYSIGLKLQSFSIFTGDSDYKRLKSTENQNSTEDILKYKVAKLKGLSLFCDWHEDLQQFDKMTFDELIKNQVSSDQEKKTKKDQKQRDYIDEILKKEFSDEKQQEHKNIIDNFALELRLQINKNQRNPMVPATMDHPQILTKIIIGNKEQEVLNQNLCLFQPQILRVLKLIELIGFYNDFKEGVLREFLPNDFSPDEKVLYINDYVGWRTLSDDSKKMAKPEQQTQAKYIRDRMRLVEAVEDYAFIVAARKNGIEQLKQLDGRQKQLDAVEVEIQKVLKIKIGRGLMISLTNQAKIEKEVRQSFSSQIDEVRSNYDQNLVDYSISDSVKGMINEFQEQDTVEQIFEANQLPADYVVLDLCLQIPSLKVSLENEYDQRVFTLEIKELDFDIKYAKKFTILKMEMEEFMINDNWSGNETWPQLAGVSNDTVQAESDSKMMSLIFEQNTDFKACPFHVTALVSKPLCVVVNMPLLQEIERTMGVALQNEKLDFEYFTQLALGRVKQLRSTAKDYALKLKQGHYEHANCSIDANLFAPIFIIPQDVFSEKKKYLQLQLGKISIKSELIQYDEKVKYCQINEKSLIYDKYHMQFEKLSLGYHLDSCSHQMVEDITLSMDVFKNLEPLHPVHPTVLLNVSFKDCIMLNMDMEIINLMIHHMQSVMIELQNNALSSVCRKMEKVEIQIQQTDVQQKFKELKDKTFKVDNTLDENEDDVDEFEDFEKKQLSVPKFVAKNTNVEVSKKEFTDIQMKFSLQHLKIQFGNLQRKCEQNQQAIYIDLNLRHLFTKISFENNNQDTAINFSVKTLEIQEQNQSNKIFFWNAKKQDEEKQLSMKIKLSESEQVDKTFGETPQSTMEMNLNLQQTIIHMNLELTSRFIQQFGQLQNVQDTLQGLEDQKSLEATEHVIEALKGKESQRYQFIRKIYQNLAIEHGKIEHEEKELMEKYIQILSEKIGQTTNPEDHPEVEVKTEDKKSSLKVVQSNYLSKVSKIVIKIQAIEFWLSDYDDNNNQDSVGQIMKFKFRSEIEYNSKNIVQNVLCQKNNEKFQNVLRNISKKEEILLNLDGISIEQEIIETWKMAQEILAGAENQITMKTSLLEPAQIKIKLTTDSFLLMDRLSKMEINLDLISLNMDYNNIGYIYFLSKRYQETIMPKLEQFRSQIEQKLNQISEEVQNRIKKVIKENVLTIAPSVLTPEEEPEYSSTKEMFDYIKGQMIEPNEPETFKREIDSQCVSVKQIKLQFIDAQLSNYLNDKDFSPIPLIQLVLKDLSLSHNLRKGLKNLSFMEISSHLNLDATYFNQITQVFEPFIEPWTLQLIIEQKVANDIMNIEISSEEQLIFNVTYGMALSLRNIYVEALEQIYAVDDLFEVQDRQQVVQQIEQKADDPLMKMRAEHAFKQQFMFINYTGMEIALWKSGQYFDVNALEEQTITISEENMDHKCVDKKFFGEDDIDSKGFQLETDLLTVDLRFEGYSEIRNIPIENNGVYSFKCLKIQENKNAKKKEINLIATVKSFGTQRMIQFESPLHFENNTDHPLTLVFTFSAEQQQIHDWKQLITPNQTFQVPLKWYSFENKQVDVYLIKKTEENNSDDDSGKEKQLIMRDITTLFARSPDTPVSIYDKNKIQSQIVELNNDFYTSVDIYGYKCLPLHTEESNPIQYFVCMNPPLVIKNLCLCPMELFEIDNPETPQQEVKKIAHIAPADSQNIIQLDISESNKSYFGLQFKDNDKNMFFSKVLPNFKGVRDVTTEFLRHAVENEIISSPKLVNSSSYAPVNLCFEQIKKPISSSHHHDLREQVLQHSLGIQLNIFIPLIIVNKTKQCLFAQDQQIDPFSSQFLNVKDKVVIQAPGFKLCDMIDIKTIGLTGTIQMDSEDPKSDEQLQFGVAITQAQLPFNKTVILTIVPRYMLINNLDSIIDVRQSVKTMRHYDPNLKLAKVQKKNEKNHPQEFHLKNFSKGKLSEQIVVRMVNDNWHEDRDIKEEEWCLPFAIDTLDDFQTDLNIVATQKKQEHWFMPQLQNYFKRIVRVIITPNTQDCDATTLIIFDDPATEEFNIVNNTDQVIYFGHFHQQPLGSLIPLLPHQKQIFVWGYRQFNEKCLIIKDEKQKLQKVITLDKISNMDKKTKELQKEVLFKVGEYQFHQTLTMTEVGTKVVTISSEQVFAQKKSLFGSLGKKDEIIPEQIEEEQKEENSLDLATLVKGFKLEVDLKGFSFSIIDNQPRELINVTIQNMCLEASSSEYKFDGFLDTRTNIKATLGLFQIDNLINDELPVILGPSKLYERMLQEIQNDPKHGQLYKMMNYVPINNVEEKENLPFIKIVIEKSEKKYEGKIGSIIRYEQVQFHIQEFFLQVETQIIIREGKFIKNILNLLDYSNTEMIKKRKQPVVLTQNYDKKFNKKSYEICTEIDARGGIKIEENRISINKISFGIIMLGSIRCQLTLQLEKTRLIDLDIEANQAVNFMSTIIKNFASIENSKLWFNELVIMEGFVTQDMLTNCIYNHYWHQFQRQILRLLGSSKLLGNPASLMDKVGLGVYEGIRDPLQGMRNGPQGFVLGVGSGMQGVVKGVVGGGFDSLSKTTGSLYTVVKQSTGNEDIRSQQKVENFGQGITQGFKGAGSEVVKGFHGIFANPFKGAREGGFQGFGQGVRTGVVGAITAPISGVLRAGESISQGVSAGANNFSNIGKTQIELFDPKFFRVRACRRIDIKGQIKALDYNLLIISYYLLLIDHPTFRFQQIRRYEILPQLDTNGQILEHKATILVVTSDHIILFNTLNFLDIRKASIAKNQVIFCEKLSNIAKYEVYLSPSGIKEDGTKINCKYFMCLIFAFEIQNHTEIQTQQEMSDSIKTRTSRNVQILANDAENIRPQAINGTVQATTSELIDQYIEAETVQTYGNPKQANIEALRIQNMLISKKQQFVMFTEKFESFNNIHMLFHQIPVVQENLSSVILFEQQIIQNEIKQ